MGTSLGLATGVLLLEKSSSDPVKIQFLLPLRYPVPKGIKIKDIKVILFVISSTTQPVKTVV